MTVSALSGSAILTGAASAGCASSRMAASRMRRNCIGRTLTREMLRISNLSRNPPSPFRAAVARRERLLEHLLQEEDGVAGRVVVDLAEEIEAQPFVERAGLEAERLQMHADAAAAARVVFRQGHHLSGVALAARGVGDPEDVDVHPLAPDLAEQPAHDRVAFAAQVVANGIPGLLLRLDDVVVDEAVDHVLGVRLVLRLERDAQGFAHATLPSVSSNRSRIAAQERRSVSAWYSKLGMLNCATVLSVKLCPARA